MLLDLTQTIELLDLLPKKNNRNDSFIILHIYTRAKMIELRFKLTLAAAIYIALIVYLIDSAGLFIVNAARISVVDKLGLNPDNDKLKVYAIQRNRKGRTEIRRTSNSGASWQGHSTKVR